MRRILLISMLFALSAAALAQAQTSEVAPVMASLASNGPVVADYRISYPNNAEGHIAKEVRHELLMLPYYSLFDDLEYSVQGRTVTLYGAVTSDHANTKSDAEKAVERIEGVDQVTNNIRILRPSAFDQQARAKVYGALFRTGSLYRYFWQAAPSIHIIVDGQRVTLKGFVDSEVDKNLATIAANHVPGIFQVTNELRVVK